MKQNLILRKLFIVSLIILYVFLFSDCKKQIKCGCEGDQLYSIDKELINASSIYYGSEGTNAYFILGTSTYYFCNPTEMFPTYKTFDSNDLILISGDIFYECNYAYYASNNSYSYYPPTYNINVTGMINYLYGKK